MKVPLLPNFRSIPAVFANSFTCLKDIACSLANGVSTGVVAAAGRKNSQFIIVSSIALIRMLVLLWRHHFIKPIPCLFSNNDNGFSLLVGSFQFHKSYAVTSTTL